MSMPSPPLPFPLSPLLGVDTSVLRDVAANHNFDKILSMPEVMHFIDRDETLAQVFRNPQGFQQMFGRGAGKQTGAGQGAAAGEGEAGRKSRRTQGSAGTTRTTTSADGRTTIIGGEGNPRRNVRVF